MWNLQDAKNRFSAVVASAIAGTPQHVTRRGKPAVVVLSASDYSRLLADARQARGSFVDHLLAFPGTVEGGEPGRAQVVPRPVDL